MEDDGLHMKSVLVSDLLIVPKRTAVAAVELDGNVC